MIDVLINAITYGNMLALMALGLTFTYITLKVPNFAHGDFIAIGAYTAYTLHVLFGVNPYWTIPVAFLISGLTGFLAYIGIFNPLSKKGLKIVDLMIAYFAVEMVLRSLILIYSQTMQSKLSVYFLNIIVPAGSIRINGITIPTSFFVSVAMVVVTLSILFILLTRTRMGIAMRAAVENPSLARIQGINVDKYYGISWFLAGGITGITGPIVLVMLPTDPNVGWVYIVRIFAASVLGGINSLSGAVVGGYLIALTEVLGTYYLSQPPIGMPTVYRIVFPFVIMIVTLIVVPNGIAGVLSDGRLPWRMIFRRRE